MRAGSNGSSAPAEKLGRRLGALETWALIIILLAGVALRLYWNNVREYSPADEAVYTGVTRAIVDAGWSSYPAVATEYLQDQRRWVYPGPLRWGNYLFTTLSCRVMGTCGPRSLAWVSTMAGIATLALTFLLAWNLIGVRAALLAAAFAATSPLQLGLGRRALQDELVVAMFLLDGLLLYRLLEKPRERRGAALYGSAVAAMTLSLGVKESFAIFLAILSVPFMVRWVRERRIRVGELLLFALPPILYSVISAVAVGGWQRFTTIAAMVPRFGLHSPAALAYQAGWFHRVLVDLLLVDPLICVAAIGGLWIALGAPRSLQNGPGWLALLTALMIAAFGLLSSKNLRYYAALDPLLRILAAWTIVEHQLRGSSRKQLLIAATVVVVSVGMDLALFHRLFITGNVYDPVTLTLTRALEMIPH